MRAVSLMEESGGFNSGFIQKFILSAEKLKALNESALNKNWDAVVSVIRDGLVCTCDGRNSKVDKYNVVDATPFSSGVILLISGEIKSSLENP